MKNFIILLTSLLLVEISTAKNMTIYTNERVSTLDYPRKVTFTGLYNSHAISPDKTLVLRLSKSSLNPPDYSNLVSMKFGNSAFNDMYSRRPLDPGEKMTIIARCSGPFNLISYIDSNTGPSHYTYECQISSMTVEEREIEVTTSTSAQLARRPASEQPPIKSQDINFFRVKGGLALQ
jgi:hypothetical protein